MKSTLLVSVSICADGTPLFPLETFGILRHNAIIQPLQQTQLLTPLNAQPESAVSHFRKLILVYPLTTKLTTSDLMG